MNQANVTAKPSIRLDKWLWAARFYRTRALAKAAIEGGKVHYNGQRVKVSKLAEIGALLIIRQGFDEKQVVIKALSGQRRSAPEAQALYEETADSLQRRQDTAERRKQLKGAHPVLSGRPNKKERRQLQRLKQTDLDGV